jgi:hypothetical protein
LLIAILNGCGQAGLTVEALAPSAETLPAAVIPGDGDAELLFPNGCTTEAIWVGVDGVWRSRRIRGVQPMTGRWVDPLAAVGGDAATLAGAYGAAVRLPILELFPDGHRAAERRIDRRRLSHFAAVGLALWIAAGAIYVGRLRATYARATHQLDASRVLVDSALALRRDLDAGQATLQTLSQARSTRSMHLRLLGRLTRGLPDSVTLIALHVGADRTVRLVGYAPRASQVVAELEQVQGLSGVRLEGAVTRELVAGRGTLDRFSIVAAESGR